METKPHILSITLKVSMLQILPIIAKKKVIHLKQNQLCVYHLLMKEKDE
jgi:hypothetical protein